MLFLTYLILGFSFYRLFFSPLFMQALPLLYVHIHYRFSKLSSAKTLDMVKVRTTSRPTVINLSKMVGEASRYWRIGVGFYDCLYSTLSQL